MNFKGLATSSGYGPKRAYPFPDGHPSSLPERSLRFDELLGKFGRGPHALNEHELNELVFECMFHGDVEALASVLATRPLHTLDIPGHADVRAWRTLLALPDSVSIDRLLLRGHQFDRVTGALLLEVMGRAGVRSVSFHSCNWNVRPGEVTCPILPNMQELHVEGTENPMPLLDAILSASQVSKFYFASNPGMTDEDHGSLANLLDTQCNAKLRDLTLRDLQAPDQTLERLLKHYAEILGKKTTTLTHLDLSGNKLSPKACRRLATALRSRTTLLDLALAGCWPEGHLVSDWSPMAMLISPASLVKLDLSNNCFPPLAKTLLTQLGWCKSLQHLRLGAAIVDGTTNRAVLADILGKLKLKSLCLPKLDNVHYGLLLNT
jgi:hypothetical protein